jgi:hypothetical protein
MGSVLAQHLPRGLRQAATPTLSGEVDLAEAPGASEEVENDGLHQPAPPVASNGQCGDGEEIGRGQALLHGHGEDQRRLPVRSRPEGSTHRSNVCTGPWHAPFNDDLGIPATCLADVELPRTSHAGTPRHRDADAIGLEALQAGGDQRRCTVEVSARPALEDGCPVQRSSTQLAGVEAQHLVRDALPTVSLQLRRDLQRASSDLWMTSADVIRMVAWEPQFV